MLYKKEEIRFKLDHTTCSIVKYFFKTILLALDFNFHNHNTLPNLFVTVLEIMYY